MCPEMVLIAWIILSSVYAKLFILVCMLKDLNSSLMV